MTVATTTRFRKYDASDLVACLELFESNCPTFFAPSERLTYRQFLEGRPSGYEVCLVDDCIVGAYGFTVDRKNTGTVNWILLIPALHGRGVGSTMMNRAIDRARRRSVKLVRIAASHLSAPFFERYGATTVTITENGWGAGLRRYDMNLRL